MKTSVLFVVLLVTGHSVFAAENNGIGKRCVHLTKAGAYGIACFATGCSGVLAWVAAAPAATVMTMSFVNIQDRPMTTGAVLTGVSSCCCLCGCCLINEAISCLCKANKHCSKACKIKTE